MIRVLCLILAFASPSIVMAQQVPEAEPSMTPERMEQIVLALDPEAKLLSNGFELTISDIPVLVVTDVTANRMRAMVPIRSTEEMTQDELLRLMQANFDSALDARYAIAHGKLWGIYIHPYAELERDQFISGLAQAVNVALTYGTLFSSGGVQFGSGDSGELQQQDLLAELLRRGQEL
ncbi:MAG: hypothetical protein ACJASV_001295 [Pseudorhodobacter sp.]|jgi:hypothetical protein